VLAIPAETCLDVNINSRLFADDTLALSDLFQKILAGPYPKTTWLRLNGLLVKKVLVRSANCSQRALKTVEDFTEFEQRAAYFDGDPVIATKKGVNVSRQPFSPTCCHRKQRETNTHPARQSRW
jgi:hypothetical protein